MRTSRNPETVHSPLAAYSHQIEVREPARWLILSGQVGQDPDGRVPEDPIEQFRVALDNISRNLDAANMGVRDIVKLTFYLVGDMDAGKRRDVAAAWLGDHRPCTTLLYVAALAAPVYRVEIDAWACRAAGE
jgi:2-iminobutanoate/2-iminopropanoate deaminase